MAEPISLASGLLTLVVAAMEAGKTLHNLVQSFQSSQRVVRELRAELEALAAVLETLREAVDGSDGDFAPLKQPLLRCGKACGDFTDLMIQCSAHSGGSRTSFRDWAKLKYMGDDIDGFRRMLAGYKSTITIALSNVNIRKAVVTINLLNEYKEMIRNTTSDLEDHLQEIDKKLQTLSPHSSTSTSHEDEAERQQIQEERESTQQCLSICADVLAHIEQVQPSVSADAINPAGASQVFTPSPGHLVPARLLTGQSLEGCKKELSSTASQLEMQLQDINARLQRLQRRRGGDPATSASRSRSRSRSSSTTTTTSSSSSSTERATIREEMASIRACLKICDAAGEQVAQTRVNVFEEVSLLDDSQQVMVSTMGDLISAKKVSAGARSIQWLGQMSDASLQQLSQDNGRRVPTPGGPAAPATAGKGKGKAEEAEVKGEGVGLFKGGRYGSGYTLHLDGGATSD